jgi:hypothetical protein
MHRIRVVTVVLMALVIGALGLSGAASAAGWEKISRDGLGNNDEATSALAGQSIVVAWTYQSSPGTSSSEAVTFTSSLTDSVISPVTVPVVSSWSALSSDPELVPAFDGTLVLLYAGIHSTLTGDPLTGIAASARAASGVWGAPVAVVPGASANYGIAGLLVDDGSSLISGDCCGDAAFVFHGSLNVGDAASGLGSVQNRAMARDGSGNVWMAWYDLDHGVVLRQLDPLTGVPIGVPAIAPGSNLIYNAGSRIALACNPAAAGCRVVYEASDQHHLLSWSPGETAPTTVASVPTDSSLGAWHAAYRADGRLWVGWILRPAVGHPLLQFTLGDVRGAGGPAYPVSLQQLDPPYHLRLQPVGNDLLLLGNFGSANAGSAQWANLVGIPGAVADTSGPKDVAVEPSTDGKGFRIQVQFQAPASCGSSCRARAELRNRTGVCLAACLGRGGKTLPGDGKVVIGTRSGFALPGGKKIRFYLTVSKASLLRTPFTTVGGFRVGNTRLRVWLTTRSGTELVVRDGHIKVSIERIRSGALPGLTGIL